MKKLVFPIILLLILSFCSGRHHYKSEFAFANKLAKEGLWKEAHMRWQRELDRGMNTAALHNNIAIALENMGKPLEAEKEYELALKLRPGHKYIQSNLDRLRRLRKNKGLDDEDEDGKKKKSKRKKRKRRD